MSYRIKPPVRKSAVDEAHLISGMERLWIVLEENRRGVLAGLAVLLLAVAAVGGVIWYDYRQGQEALALHEEAMRFYITRPADNPEQAAKNLAQAITRFRRVVKEFPRSSVAPHALYQLAQALEEDNKLDGAIEAYREFVGTFGGSDTLVGLVYQRLGYAYLQKGDWEKAMESFSAVLAVPGALNKDYTLLEMGKLEEGESRPEGALARYKELRDNYPQSPLASEADVRINALEVKQEPPAEGKEEQGRPEVPSQP